jgi:hypothetical protein
MPKGSTESKPLRLGNRTRWVDVDRLEVREWMSQVAKCALIERQRRVARGDTSFPYEAPMMLQAWFVFDRPRTQPVGPPITSGGRTTKEGIKAAFGDLDKLVRAIPDALESGQISTGKDGRTKVPKAAVIKNDSLITQIVCRKAFRDEAGMRPAGCYFTLLRASEDPVDLGPFV